MWNHLQSPARPDDILELPSPAAVSPAPETKSGKHKRHGKKLAAGLCLGLTLLSPGAADAVDTTLYISGGGGGYGSIGAQGGQGGPRAYEGADSIGGGAYVGDALNDTNAATDHQSVNDYGGSGVVLITDGAYLNGGSGELTATDLTYSKIKITGGNGAYDLYRGAVGNGGHARLTVNGIMKKSSLYLNGGRKTNLSSNNAAYGEGGEATATIATWDARDQATTFSLDGSGGATTYAHIRHLILGNDQTFTVTKIGGASYDTDEYSVYDRARFEGDFEAEGKPVNFYLSDQIGNGDTMLRVSGKANIQGSTVNMAFPGGSTPLKGGDKVILIDAAGTLNGMSANTQTSAAVTGSQGVSLVYDFALSREGNQLVAILGAGGANPQTKAFLQGRLAQLAFISQGADSISQGVMSAFHGLAPDFAYDLVPFFITQGGWSRYDTGSHIDVEGVGITTGLAWRGQTRWGAPALALFFESGWGNHKTHLNTQAATGRGDLAYYGGGLLGHFDFNPFGPGNFWAEASFRAGHSDLSFRSGDIRDALGRTADFNSSAPYYGLHAGFGYDMKLNQSLGLGLYSKYYWTHLAGDEENILGDKFHLDAVDSRRWRNGLRLSFDIPAQEYVLEPFIGAAYEYEFSGTAKGYVHGHGLDEPSIRGGSAIGEAGLSLYPSDHEGLSVDLALTGYTGRREGISGDLRLKWEF
ncbi:MAG: autotransporter outer membrane beta-barrel domain-containing protein [Desulfovibrionaceae bacterium]|nr:autotransporter outer membrane beta-barrel domain-containing protein [Desulfovibrionaceae bacterium]